MTKDKKIISELNPSLKIIRDNKPKWYLPETRREGYRNLHKINRYGLLLRSDHVLKLNQKYNDEIEAIVCIALCPEVPFTVREMDYMSQAANQDGQRGEIVIAYTVWSRKRGAGKEIIKKLGEWVKENKFARLVTLSPLTPMATHFHIRNGAKQIHINEETQNFEYKL